MKSLHKWAKTLEKQLKDIVISTYDDKQMEQFLMDGVTFCQSICPVDTGDLKESITYKYDSVNKRGYIYSNLPPATSKNTNYDLQYIVYVEFGTGIYEKHGIGRKTPWVYKDPNSDNYYKTKGQQSQPFMYNTTEYLKGIAPKGVIVKMTARGIGGGSE